MWQQCSDCSIFSFETVFTLLFFCAFPFPRPLSSANLGDFLASTFYSTSAMEEETKRTKKGWQRCSELFYLLFRNSVLASLFLRLSFPSSSFLGDPQSGPLLLRERALPL